jgi:hypothetical protein
VLLPNGSAVQKAASASNGRRHRIGAAGHAFDLDRSQRGRTNLGLGRAQQETLASEQMEALKENTQANRSCRRRNYREVCHRNEVPDHTRDHARDNDRDDDRDEEGQADDHSASLDSLDGYGMQDAFYQDKKGRRKRHG